jgi:lysozyme family protein
MFPEIFERCISIVLKSEGGYVNNLSDYGGETNYGIAKRFFPALDIKHLTIDEAKEIYYRYYWQPMHLEGIISPDSVLEIFDMGVNSGKPNAIRMAQRVVNVNPDGKLGPVSSKAINNFPNFLAKYKQARREYYLRISQKRNNQVFLKGWLNRVSNTHF